MEFRIAVTFTDSLARLTGDGHAWACDSSAVTDSALHLPNARLEGVALRESFRRNVTNKGGEPMDLRWRNFPLVLTLAAAFVTPAYGQSERAESIPDFSGI